MAIIEVIHHWSDEHGACYDCGNPAAFYAPDMYGETEGPRKENKLCSVCAANHAATDGERIVWLTDPQDL